MKFIRIILFPLVPIYYMVTRLRNYVYDVGITPSKFYKTPIICVGNLSTGGTGKTPMIEYLIRLLNNDNKVATLSRGYKRNTKGFILADVKASVVTLGDEPFQFYKKFKNIIVAVDSNRQNGINELLSLEVKPNIILLDDAFQHRKVKASFNILLTAYYNLYSNDIVLPTGNLREPRSGANRADIIVVTKCPVDIAVDKKIDIAKKLKLKTEQKLFFSYINYSKKVISKDSELTLEELTKFTLVTGIANAKPLTDFLIKKGLVFEHLEYPDHYSFKPRDIKLLSNKGMLVTTEKDYVRLSGNEKLLPNLFYLPIELSIDNGAEFDSIILKTIS